ncbi:MAG TPA: TRAP transporter small permease [Candidatus Methylomirabilis sp.]|nr:TRAP transporter small permease [Candidatus Methylomirabilis sp.]
MEGFRLLLKNCEEFVAGIFMVFMSLATFSNVIARYIFNNPIQWAEEFSRYAFIWVVFMGAAVCTKRKRHIAIDSLVLVLPRRIQTYFHVLVDLFILGLMVVIVYYGSILTISATNTTATLKVPQYIVYIVVPISGALIFMYSIGDLRQHLRRLLGSVESP